jgi:hypothetical protein
MPAQVSSQRVQELQLGRARRELEEPERGAEGGAALRRQGFDGEDAPSPITRRTTVTSACVSNGSAKSSAAPASSPRCRSPSSRWIAVFRMTGMLR